MKKIIFLHLLLIAIGFSCSKKSADTPIVMVPERLTVSPLNTSINVGETVIYKSTYYNNLGEESVPNGNIIYTSSNPAQATITSAGIATGIGTGQVEIKAQYNTAIAATLLSIVSNKLQVATISIEPEVEIALNGMQKLVAIAKNIDGMEIPGKTFSWESDNSTLVAIDAITGEVTGNVYGTANITAKTENIISNAAMVQVSRTGNFMGMGSMGKASLKIRAGLLNLETSAAFSVSSAPPDLRIYLSANSGNVSNALEITTLNKRSGAQNWVVPGNVSITKYKYVLVWCKQFGGTYGTVELPN